MCRSRFVGNVGLFVRSSSSSTLLSSDARTHSMCVCGNRFEQSSGPTRFLIIVLSTVYTSIDVYMYLVLLKGVGREEQEDRRFELWSIFLRGKGCVGVNWNKFQEALNVRVFPS